MLREVSPMSNKNNFSWQQLTALKLEEFFDFYVGFGYSDHDARRFAIRNSLPSAATLRKLDEYIAKSKY